MRQSCGQSAAVRTGVRAARAPVVVTLDGDGQNDPAYIPRLVRGAGGGRPARRSRGRASGWAARTPASRSCSRASPTRCAARVLKDGTRDTGCGLKAFRRDVYLALPYFDALHRFMPALVRREGYDVVLVDVVDRPRLTGVSNYGFFDRLWVGILDLAGVWWLIRRRRKARARERHRRSCLMLIAFSHGLVDYLYDVFVARFDFWLAFGIVAQLLFTARFIVQWIASERAGRSVMPLAFWMFSIAGGLMTLVYGLVRREPDHHHGPGACRLHLRAQPDADLQGARRKAQGAAAQAAA